MARPVTESLEYFPLNVTFPDDPKILLLEERHGMAGGYTAFKMLCFIYQQGYYLKWDDLMPVVYAKRVGHGLTSVEITSILSSMIEFGLLSRTMFDRHKILTSGGIQKRWLKIIRNAKRTADIDPRYLITEGINSVDSEFPPEETPPKREETPSKGKGSTQSKVKESKVKEIRDINISFDVLWNAYGKKVGDKKWCVRHWEEVLTDADRQAIMDRLPLYLARLDPKDVERKYQLHLKTYLTQRRWENDEYVAASKPVFDKYNPPFVA